MHTVYRQALVGSNKCASLSQKDLFALLTLFTGAEGDSQSIQLPPGQHQKLFSFFPLHRLWQVPAEQKQQINFLNVTKRL